MILFCCWDLIRPNLKLIKGWNVLTIFKGVLYYIYLSLLKVFAEITEKMAKIQAYFVALLTFAVLFNIGEADIILTSCARMDIPVLSKIAAGACITSCKYQV